MRDSYVLLHTHMAWHRKLVLITEEGGDEWGAEEVKQERECYTWYTREKRRETGIEWDRDRQERQEQQKMRQMTDEWEDREERGANVKSSRSPCPPSIHCLPSLTVLDRRQSCPCPSLYMIRQMSREEEEEVSEVVVVVVRWDEETGERERRVQAVCRWWWQRPEEKRWRCRCREEVQVQVWGKRADII